MLALDLAVDIHPEGREVRSRGSMLLGNTGGARITEFVVSFPRSLRVDALSIPATLVERADDLGARRYAFDPPLRPIERVRMTFDVVGKHARDRTFLAASDILPFPGYDAALAPANDRLAPHGPARNAPRPRGRRPGPPRARVAGERPELLRVRGGNPRLGGPVVRVAASVWPRRLARV